MVQPLIRAPQESMRITSRIGEICDSRIVTTTALNSPCFTSSNNKHISLLQTTRYLALCCLIKLSRFGSCFSGILCCRFRRWRRVPCPSWSDPCFALIRKNEKKIRAKIGMKKNILSANVLASNPSGEKKAIRSVMNYDKAKEQWAICGAFVSLLTTNSLRLTTKSKKTWLTSNQCRISHTKRKRLKHYLKLNVTVEFV